LAVIPGMTQGAANILKAVILSTTQATDSDVHCMFVIFPLICDNQVINCQAGTWPSLLVAILYQLAAQ